MNRSSPEGSPPPVDQTTYTNALAVWTEASFDLFVNFKKIRTCLQQNAIPGGTEQLRSSHIGQCSREQIMALFTAMQTELDGLLQELEHLSRVSQSDYSVKYPRLIAQTTILNQLNQQATDKLFLAALSAA